MIILPCMTTKAVMCFMFILYTLYTNMLSIVFTTNIFHDTINPVNINLMVKTTKNTSPIRTSVINTLVNQGHSFMSMSPSLCRIATILQHAFHLVVLTAPQPACEYTPTAWYIPYTHIYGLISNLCQLLYRSSPILLISLTYRLLPVL